MVVGGAQVGVVGGGWGVVVRVKRAEKGVGVDAAGLNRLPANRNYRTVT